MGILDWFKNRSSHFDPQGQTDEMILQAVNKAAALTNPRLKLLHSYQERLAPAVALSLRYIQDLVLSLEPAIPVSPAFWAFNPALRAFFVAPTDIAAALSRSQNLRTLFEKYPALDEAYLVLVMSYSEQRVLGISMRDNMIQRDVAQTVVGFSNHQARICGQEDAEIRRLLGTQAFEYLVAQALSEIGEDRSERRELSEKRELIRARLRLLQQQGPGLGSVFATAPAAGEVMKLEAQLLENERQMESLGSPQAALDAELETLREVLGRPERYIRVEPRPMRLSTMNVVLDAESTDVASEVVFSLAQLLGVPQIERAFIMARFARSDLLPPGINFDDAARYL